MKFFLYGIIAISLCTLSSCSKKEDAPESTRLGGSGNFSLADYPSMTNFDVKSLLLISSENFVTQDYTAPNSWNRFLNGINVYSFQDVSNNPVARVNGIERTIPRLDLGEQSNVFYFNPGDANETTLFGNKVSIDAFGIKGEMYVPEKVSILSPIPNNQQPYSMTAVQRNSPLTIKWNSDPKSRGVFIEIEYHGFVSGASYIQIDYASDNGEFTIPDSWLQNIPDNEDFSVSVIRGDYHSTPKGELIGCISSAKMMLQIMP